MNKNYLICEKRLQPSLSHDVLVSHLQDTINVWRTLKKHNLRLQFEVVRFYHLSALPPHCASRAENKVVVKC